MVMEQEDVEYYPGGEGGEVPDGLHPRDGSLYHLVCVRPVPQAKLRPLHGSGLLQQLLPERTLKIPRGE